MRPLFKGRTLVLLSPFGKVIPRVIVQSRFLLLTSERTVSPWKRLCCDVMPPQYSPSNGLFGEDLSAVRITFMSVDL